MSANYTILAARALDLIGAGARIGLGSGRTATAFVHALAERVRQGLRVQCVPTSLATGQLADQLGIPLTTLDAEEPLDLTVDGADEIEVGTLNAIKGWGGALVRERIVAAASRRQVLLVTREKLVDRLGSRGKLPVEVLPFAAPFCRRRIERLQVGGGLRPVLRQNAGRVVVTDNGNWILDCGLGAQEDPHALDRDLRAIPGVIDTGLFLGTAGLVLLDEDGRVREMQRG